MEALFDGPFRDRHRRGFGAVFMPFSRRPGVADVRFVTPPKLVGDSLPWGFYSGRCRFRDSEEALKKLFESRSRDSEQVIARQKDLEKKLETIFKERRVLVKI